MNTKNEIRAFYKKLRQSHTNSERKAFDSAISSGFLNLDEYKSCRILLAFVSKDIEVDTKGIISRAFCDGKTIAVPKCDADNNTMSFYIINSFDDLKPGCFDIPEPKDSCEKLDINDSAVCLVPGLSFDKRGFRVGFGGGYYDRFLSEFKEISVGVCYSDCVASELPDDEYDCPVNILVTDNKIYRKD